MDKCNNSPPDIGHDDIESPKVINSPKRFVIKKLDFPSKFSSKYHCKIFGSKKHKKHYFYKINPSSNLVRVEMISEHSATLAPTLHSTLISPSLLVPIELQFCSKKGHVGVIPEQRVLRDKILKGRRSSSPTPRRRTSCCQWEPSSRSRGGQSTTCTSPRVWGR